MEPSDVGPDRVRYSAGRGRDECPAMAVARGRRPPPGIHCAAARGQRRSTGARRLRHIRRGGATLRGAHADRNASSRARSRRSIGRRWWGRGILNLELGAQMNLWRVMCAVCLLAWSSVVQAQPVRAVPRPPAQAPGPPRPEDGSAAPDGYAPIPEWLGQTRASRAAKTAAYDVETVAEGFAAAFCFSFLPDGRIIVGERPGRLKIVGKEGSRSDPIDGMPANLFVRGGQGLYEVRPDRAFPTNRTIYLTYTVLPNDSNPAALPRSPGVVVAARARLSPDDKRLEDVKVLLNAEGTGGRLVQAPDRTLFVTSTIPAGLGINSVDWPQPQQYDSNMGKVLRINADGSIPKDNPFAGRAGAHPEI